ncbi:MAG TPA: zinc metalloprotease HtpX [Anaeromyxobacteraceae bacterium]|nr:zinc metalloprotease HtpX [Anaeromyxobacteraceae bacterium]
MAWSESTPVRGIPGGNRGVGRNYLKTAMLMAFLIAVLAIGGSTWGGYRGMLLFGGLGLVINFFSYWFSDRIALMAHRAQPVTREQVPQLYEIVERLTRKAKLPMPKLYVIPSETPNAFATGRNPSHAAVAVTEGIMRLLDWRELEGVLAHELSHVRNRDILISTIAAAVAGLISSLGHMIQWGAMFGGLSRRDEEGRGGGLEMLAWAILAPIMAMIIQLAVSRSREYGADASGAELVGDPEPLADALLKLERGNEAIPYQYGGPATAHLFIVHPFSGAGGAIMNLLSTHPPIEERVRRLREMKRGMRFA